MDAVIIAIGLAKLILSWVGGGGVLGIVQKMYSCEALPGTRCTEKARILTRRQVLSGRPTIEIPPNVGEFGFGGSVQSTTHSSERLDGSGKGKGATIEDKPCRDSRIRVRSLSLVLLSVVETLTVPGRFDVAGGWSLLESATDSTT